jgi:hypothetical protein
MLKQHGEQPLDRCLLLICFALVVIGRIELTYGERAAEEEQAFITRAQVGHTSSSHEAAALQPAGSSTHIKVLLATFLPDQPSS